MATNHFVFHQLIKKPVTPAGALPLLLIDPHYTTDNPYAHGLPTFKYSLKTRYGDQTREYLPIKHDPSTTEYLDKTPGTTWIPVQTANHPKTTIYLLAITNAPIFLDIQFPFRWETNIQPGQLTITNKLDIYPIRQRIWNRARGSSYLRAPTPAGTNTLPQTQGARQICTITVPTWYVHENQALESILKRGDPTLPEGPHWGNVYLRHSKQKLNHYYVLRRTPSHDGVKFEHGDNNLFFHRIKPLTSPKFRFIYKLLTKRTRAGDWVPLLVEEFSFLHEPLTPLAHARLIDLL